MAETTWSGAWNNWIAPFSACPRCGASLNWQQCEDVLDRPMIHATCCAIRFGASLEWSVAPPHDGRGGAMSETPEPTTLPAPDATWLREDNLRGAWKWSWSQHDWPTLSPEDHFGRAIRAAHYLAQHTPSTSAPRLCECGHAHMPVPGSLPSTRCWEPPCPCLQYTPLPPAPSAELLKRSPDVNNAHHGTDSCENTHGSLPPAPSEPTPLAAYQRDAIACSIRYLRSGGVPPSPVQLEWAWTGALALSAAPSPGAPDLAALRTLVAVYAQSISRLALTTSASTDDRRRYAEERDVALAALDAALASLTGARDAAVRERDALRLSRCRYCEDEGECREIVDALASRTPTTTGGQTDAAEQPPFHYGGSHNED